ncbi:MAG: hypothetical protein HPY69_12105 [Armatimonadetes bacterium]|nr:hypothetical protein [Armatimonadota bacterium]
MRPKLVVLLNVGLLLSLQFSSVEAAGYFRFDGKWGSLGSGAGQFWNPVHLTLDGVGRVYVVDFSNHRVQRFGPDMTFLTQWGEQGSDDGQFSWPVGIAVSSQDKVYVSCENHRVQFFTLDGSFLGKFGSYGSDPGLFNVPSGLAMDDADNLYVADAANHRVQKFSASGSFLKTWGSQGSGNTNFYGPRGIAFGAGGYLFVADTSNHRVVKYTRLGTFVAKWGAAGSANGQFSSPCGIACGPDNMVYVADSNNHRIQRFSPTGVWKETWGAYGSGDGQLDQPFGIVVDSSNRVWVTELGNDRVQRFRPNTPPTAPTKVLIKPTLAYDDEDLIAGASGSTDADGDTITYRYQWWLSTDGGQTWTAGLARKVLPASSTTVGQKWKVQAWAHDGVSKSAKVYSPVVTILANNQPPTAPALVKVTPTSPRDGDKLTATASGATDPDGDTLTYRYQWYKSTNGVNWVQGPAGRFVDPSLTEVGQYWRCRARAFDGVTTGPARLSATVQIGAGSAAALALTATAQGGEISHIVVSLSAPANVRATVTNMAGIVVAELPARDLEAGINTLHWNGVSRTDSKVPGGMYLVRVTAATADGSQTSVLAPLRR